MTTLEELKAKMQAGQQPTTAGLPALQQLPQTSPFPAVAQATAHTPTPATTAAPGLDLNSGEAAQGGREVAIPFTLEGTVDFVLDQFVHMNTRKGAMYKAVLTVEAVSEQQMLGPDGLQPCNEVRPGQQRALLFTYQPTPRTQEEVNRNGMQAREIRQLIAACFGASPDDKSFDANEAIGTVQKASVTTPSLGLRARMQRVGYPNPKARTGRSYATTYSPRG